jgi:hypothetical protein
MIVEVYTGSYGKLVESTPHRHINFSKVPFDIIFPS